MTKFVKNSEISDWYEIDAKTVVGRHCQLSKIKRKTKQPTPRSH